MTNIPSDQRSVLAIAKIRGLVGKTIEIDEKSTFRRDYVRIKIACRDVTKVSKTAEGVLGITLFDFGFEREVTEESNEKYLKSGIKVTKD